MKYYVDTCIWLNILKKEKLFYKSSKELIESNEITISTITLKELSYKINLNNIITQLNFLTKIEKTKNEDYLLARKYEKENNFNLSFYDYLHVAIAKRLFLPLVTRDRDLIIFAKTHIQVFKPNY